MPIRFATCLNAALFALLVMPPERAAAAELKVLTAGAMKQVVLAVVPQFEKQGHKLIVDNDTVGALQKRIEGGETFDIVISAPRSLSELAAKGKVTGAPVNLARVGIGVMVKDGAPKPDVSSVEAFQRALLAAKSVAYIDPASGGSSGIYLDGLLDKLGIADQVRPKAKLKKGGLVAELITGGEAELGVHQISEIVVVKGVTLVGPLPAEIQNFTTYAGAVSATTKDAVAAKAFIDLMAGPAAAAILREKGMERPS